MIRITFSIILIAIVMIGLNIANSQAETSDEIAALENQYFVALENQDQELMDSLLAEDFVISSMSSNWSMNKEEFLKTVPKQVITSQEITAVKVHVQGSKANSQVDISMTKTFEGKDHSGDYEVYSVWVNKDGSWKLVERKIKLLSSSK